MRMVLGALSILLLLSGCGPSKQPPPAPLTPQAPAPAPRESIATETIGRQEQEACVPVRVNNRFAQADCDEGLVCAPDFGDATVGTCRVDCLTRKVGKVAKNSGICPAGRSCQIAVSSILEPMGAFCLPKQNNRDGLCLAMGDAEACGNNRHCLPSDVARNAEGQQVAREFICRDACPYGQLDADKRCGEGEHCTKSPYEKGAGLCVKGISWAREVDFTSSGFAGESCNEVSDHRFCDNTWLDGLEKPAHTACIQSGKTEDVGFCVAVCSTPTLGEVKGGQLMCPTGFECSLEFSRKRGLVKSLKKPCDASKCEAGKPCVEQCGPGDAECLTVNTQGGKVSVCAAPFGTCQPR